MVAELLLIDLRVRDGKRLSVFRTYAFPYMDRPNLTVLTHALVNKAILDEKRTTGVEIEYDGTIQRINAGLEIVLSLSAIHTPKVLMLSGIGDQAELQRLGIPVVQHLPGVGQNFQDHFAVGCVWEYQEPLAPHNNGGEATFFWKSNSRLDTPDLQTCQVEVPLCSAETAAKFNPPHSSFWIPSPENRDERQLLWHRALPQAGSSARLPTPAHFGHRTMTISSSGAGFGTITRRARRLSLMAAGSAGR
jgi:choline dehydrogenase